MAYRDVACRVMAYKDMAYRVIAYTVALLFWRFPSDFRASYQTFPVCTHVCRHTCPMHVSLYASRMSACLHVCTHVDDQVLLAEQWAQQYPAVKIVSTHPGWVGSYPLFDSYFFRQHAKRLRRTRLCTCLNTYQRMSYAHV